MRAICADNSVDQANGARLVSDGNAIICVVTMESKSGKTTKI
jgi:hypothetical protein